jgi:hypothetical protein
MDYLVSVVYGEEDIIDTQSATRGKGMTVSVWEQ